MFRQLVKLTNVVHHTFQLIMRRCWRHRFKRSRFHNITSENEFKRTVQSVAVVERHSIDFVNLLGLWPRRDSHLLKNIWWCSRMSSASVVTMALSVRLQSCFIGVLSLGRVGRHRSSYISCDDHASPMTLSCFSMVDFIIKHLMSSYWQSSWSLSLTSLVWLCESPSRPTATKPSPVKDDLTMQSYVIVDVGDDGVVS